MAEQDKEMQDKPQPKAGSVACDKRVRERLKLTEENYRTIFENSAVAITVSNKDEKIVSWNKFAEALLGMDEDDLYLRDVSSLYPEEEWRRIRSQHIRQKGIQHHFETKVVRKDGQEVDVDISLSVLKRSNGEVIGSIGILADITERKRAEEALRKSKELFEKTFDSQPDAIFILDAAVPPAIIDCNTAATKIFGYSREEMRGRTTAFLHVNETTLRDFQRHLFPAADKYGFLHMPEFHMKRKDGTIFTTEHSVVALTNEKQERIGWVSVICDITERKRAEQALRESEELSKGIIETAATGIYLLQNGRFKYVNRLMEEILGYTSEELLGTLSVDYIHPEDREMARERAIEALKGHSSVDHEFRIVRKDLETAWISERITSIEYGGNRVVLGTLMDITDRKMAEAASQEYTRRIETLLAVGNTVGQTLNLTSLLDNVLHRVLAVMNVRAAGIFLVDKEANELVLKAHLGFSTDFARKVARMRIGRGFAGRSALLGKPVVMGNGSPDMRFDPTLLEREGLNSLCSVPIIAKDKILGVVSIGSCASSDFSEQDVRLLTSIATQIGVAIDNAQLYEKAVEIAFTDDLTGLYNRRYLMEQFGREFARALRKRTSLSLLMIDMDGLKAINDRFGHQRGSECLKQLARIIKANTRTSDVAARFGGDEFLLLAPDTDSSEAEQVGERLRSEVHNYQFDDGEVRMSITVGVASFPEHALDVEEIIKKADDAMYEAKRAGKNRVCVANVPAASKAVVVATPPPSSSQ